MVVNNSFEYKGYTGIGIGGSVAENFFKYWADNTTGLGMESSIVAKSIAAERPINENNPNYLYLNIKQSTPAFKLYNYGYQGGLWESDNESYVAGLTESYAMNVVKGHTYRLSFFADLSEYAASDATDQYNGVVRAYLRSNTEDKISEVVDIEVDNLTGWTKYTAEMKATHTDLGALVLQFNGIGKINLDCISLMDADSWGMDDPRYTGGKFRNDLIEAIADMHPTFFRFPGGCAAEGTLSWDYAYQWKNSIGALEERKGVPNLWGYYQSYGIGFYEYFLLCEDLDMAPVPVIPCGLICQARMGTDGALMIDAVSEATRFREEVVDNFAHLVYFARGSVDSADTSEKYWAQKRVDMGHPEPFELEFISLGNENWGPDYYKNFSAAVRMLRAYSYAGQTVDFIEHWGLRIITTSGTDFDGRSAWDADNVKFNYNYDWINNTKEGSKYLYDNNTFIVDEHYYMLPGDVNNPTNDAYSLLGNLNRYNRNGTAPQGTDVAKLGGRAFYNRDGAKVFVGEYAANYWNQPAQASNGAYFNGLYSAIAEAAYMCNYERNSDIVEMASYAPLMARKGADGWAVDGIWFNAANLVKTPNYFVQEMFGSFVGDVYIPSTLSIANTETSVTVNTENKEIYVKIVNWSESAHNVTVDLSGLTSLYGQASSAYTLYQMGQNGTRAAASGVVNSIDAYDGAANYAVKPNYYRVENGKLVRTNGTSASGAIACPGISVSVAVFTYGERNTNDATAKFSVYGSEIAAEACTDIDDESHINLVTIPYATYTYRKIPEFKIATTDPNAVVGAVYASEMNEMTMVTVTSGTDTKLYKFRYAMGDKPVITLKSARSATINTEGAYTLDYSASVGDTVRVVTSGGYYIADKRIFFAVAPGDYVLTLISGTDDSVTENVYITVVTAPEVQDGVQPPDNQPTQNKEGCGSAVTPVSMSLCAAVLLGAGVWLMRRKRTDRI